MTQDAHQPKPRRRWLQYSLRGLLVLTLLAAIGAWWLSREVAKAEREQQAIDALLANEHVSLFFTFQLDEYGQLQRGIEAPTDHDWLRSWLGDAFFDDVIELRLGPFFEFTKENAALIREMPEIEVIYAQGPLRIQEPGAAAVFGELSALRELVLLDVELTDEDISTWGNLTQLEQLSIHGTFSAAGIESMTANLPKLEELQLMNCTFGPGVLRSLGNLNALKHLEIELCTLADMDLSGLENLPLEELEIRGSNIADEALVHISNIQTLVELDFYRSDVTDAGLEHLGALRLLKIINLKECAVDGSGLKHLAKLPRLEALRLNRTNITDEHLPGLAEFASLRYLDLNETLITDAGVPALVDLELDDLKLPQSITEASLPSLSLMKAVKTLSLPAHISAEAIAELRAALPKCNIVKVPPGPVFTRRTPK